MSKVFDLTDTGEPSEATRKMAARIEMFLEVFKHGTDQEWLDDTHALLVVLARKLLEADDPHHAIDVAIEILQFGHEVAPALTR